MQKTLESILNDIGAYVDQDTTLPTGVELVTRINFVNQAMTEWEESYQWAQLRVLSNLTFAFSGTSFALPINFKKLMSMPTDVSQASNNQYTQIRPEDRLSTPSLSKYCFVVGDDARGRALVINPPLASGASITFDYQSYPSSLATLTDISVCPQPNFLVKRAIGYVLESRSDTRFPQVKADADVILEKMIEEENSPSAAQENRIKDWPKVQRFTIGED